ncbi:hypothetical protein L218DRAFT_754516 [Marasmius fiardii PR-910]|nr:hypothetical protein L218DRAFT_754516 [Marasmius fiardii PR-910]
MANVLRVALSEGIRIWTTRKKSCISQVEYRRVVEAVVMTEANKSNGSWALSKYGRAGTDSKREWATSAGSWMGRGVSGLGVCLLDAGMSKVHWSAKLDAVDVRGGGITNPRR